jgi:hypothetical protein
MPISNQIFLARMMMATKLRMFVFALVKKVARAAWVLTIRETTYRTLAAA